MYYIRIMTICYIIIRDIILKVIHGYRGGGEVLTLPPPLEILKMNNYNITIYRENELTVLL